MYPSLHAPSQHRRRLMAAGAAVLAWPALGGARQHAESGVMQKPCTGQTGDSRTDHQIMRRLVHRKFPCVFNVLWGACTRFQEFIQRVEYSAFVLDIEALSS